jgi:hypothetical protein
MARVDDLSRSRVRARRQKYSLVRTWLRAGGSWIRTLGPPIAKGSFRFGEGEAGKGTETTSGGPDTLST